jgi:hypothetical protein
MPHLKKAPRRSVAVPLRSPAAPVSAAAAKRKHARYAPFAHTPLFLYIIIPMISLIHENISLLLFYTNCTKRLMYCFPLNLFFL